MHPPLSAPPPPPLPHIRAYLRRGTTSLKSRGDPEKQRVLPVNTTIPDAAPALPPFLAKGPHTRHLHKAMEEGLERGGVKGRWGPSKEEEKERGGAEDDHPILCGHFPPGSKDTREGRERGRQGGNGGRGAIGRRE